MAGKTSRKSANVAKKLSSTTTDTPRIIYHKDGSIWARGAMMGGKMHGYWEFFRKDGSIMRSGSFDRERQVGTWTTYDASGKPVKVTEINTGAKTKPRKEVAKSGPHPGPLPGGEGAVRKPKWETTRAKKR